MDSVKIKEYKKGESPFNVVSGHLQAVGAGIKYFVKPQRITLKYPDESMSLPTGYRGMIRLYKDVCIGCTLCAMVCPADAMKMVTDQGKKFPTINYGRCVFCAFCVDICPVDALKETGVHDAAFSNRRELIFNPERFDQDFDQPPLRPVVRKVKAVIDEDKGIKYVPDTE